MVGSALWKMDTEVPASMPGSDQPVVLEPCWRHCAPVHSQQLHGSEQSESTPGSTIQKENAMRRGLRSRWGGRAQSRSDLRRPSADPPTSLRGRDSSTPQRHTESTAATCALHMQRVADAAPCSIMSTNSVADLLQPRSEVPKLTALPRRGDPLSADRWYTHRQSTWIEPFRPGEPPVLRPPSPGRFG